MKTLADFGTLNAAEEKLLNACMSGDMAKITETRPTEAITEGDNANTIRASLIRWLALGGNPEHSLHAHGLQLQGAWINGILDLEGTGVKSNLQLEKCYFTKAPNIMDMKLNGTLSLKGSLLEQGLHADRAQIAGGVFLSTEEREGVLSDSFTSTGEIRLLGLTIGGNLDFSGANIKVQDGLDALTADRAQIKGDVFLCDGFTCTGTIRLLGAIIGADLICRNAKFEAQAGQVNLSADGVQIAGSIFLVDKFSSTGAICFAGANLKMGLTLMGLEKPLKALDLSNCAIGFLQSEANAWDEKLNLDGFVYSSLRSIDWQTTDYLAWLKKQSADDYGTTSSPHLFKPQPWQQLMGVLRNMGHNDQANEIGITFEKQRFAIGKVQGFLGRFLHKRFGCLAGYGYKPLRLVEWMLAIWLCFGAFYWCAAYHGVFTPSDPLVFQLADYEGCRPVDEKGDPRKINNAAADQNTHNWYTCGKLKGEYTTFSPLTYSLDVILPLVDLGQEKTWGTYIDTPKACVLEDLMQLFSHQLSLNFWIRLMIWVEILFGWVASLMLVAVLTGLTERKKG